MSKRVKKIVGTFALLLTGFLIWYLVINPYDYLVTFKVNTTAGTINQSLKLWNLSLESPSPFEQNDLNRLTQKINLNDTLYRYEWEISSVNDSISKVNVYVTDIDNSLQNKLTIPFSNTDFEKITKSTITNFVKQLNDHLKAIKVTVLGESSTQSTYCAYVSIKEAQLKKAKGMMQHYSFLNSFLPSEGVKMNGPPFIEVTDWNMQQDSIAYNFCFPIIKSDSLPKHKTIKYKQYNGVKAIKAVYNGNYMTSDRAWYALLKEARRRDIEVEETPIEVFFSNPNFGGDELNWKAEIFMPIKKSQGR
jgi:effector-binding domain-containing protein